MDYWEIIRTQLALITPVHRDTPVAVRGITAAVRETLEVVREITAAVRETTVVGMEIIIMVVGREIMLAMALGHISKIIKKS